MKFLKEASAQACDTLLSHTTGVWKRRKRQAQWRAIAGLGLIFGSLTLRAGADTTIFLYNSNSQPVDVTASYSYSAQQHYLYDAMGNLVGTVDDSGVIYDLSGRQIGYIVTSDGGDGSG